MTTFLDCVLGVVLSAVALLCIYQFMNESRYKDIGTKYNEKFFPVIFDTCKYRNPLNSIRNEGLPHGVIYDGQPVHRVGPVVNFHQMFKPNLPELGWRNYYLSKYNDYNVPMDKNFDGTIIRNYLDNLENVDNLYRKCD
jgi:hypothetical protein